MEVVGHRPRWFPGHRRVRVGNAFDTSEAGRTRFASRNTRSLSSSLKTGRLAIDEKKTGILYYVYYVDTTPT